MKNIRSCKPIRREIRFGNAANKASKLTSAEWEEYSKKAVKKGIKKIYLDSRSLYYGQPENKHKDLRNRKNWRLRHPDYKPNRLELGI